MKKLHVCTFVRRFAAVVFIASLFLGIVPICVRAQTATATAEKKYKDPAEYEVFNEVTKDFAAKNYTKAIAGLDKWAEKYPESEFKSDRQLFYVQAYFAAGQPAKTIEAAGPLLDGPQIADAAAAIRLLYTTTVAIQQIPDPAASQIAISDKAARQLQTFDKMPAGMAAADWEKARAEFRTTANSSLLYMALAPIAAAMRAKDCTGAETLSRRVLEGYPSSAQAAWYLGSAAFCLYKTDPTKAPLAIYEFARAAALDPAVGMVDPKWQQTNVEPNLIKLYEFYHGADPEGLKKLKELAVKSPLPPADFALQSKAQIAQQKQETFEKDHPDLALWVKIKAALLADGAEEYFSSSLKDAVVPPLHGRLVEAKPACRPIELIVSIPVKDDEPVPPEIVLKLDKPLAGKPELDSEIRWEGIARSFAKKPFQLTMEAETQKIQGLRTTPCAAVPKKRVVR